jgi:hypothetical protein
MQVGCIFALVENIASGHLAKKLSDLGTQITAFLLTKLSLLPSLAKSLQTTLAIHQLFLQNVLVAQIMTRILSFSLSVGKTV